MSFFRAKKTSQKSKARLGVIRVGNYQVKTPCFMPIATKGAVKTLDTLFLKKDLKTQILLINTYHLFLRPGMKILGRFEILKEYRGGSFRVFFAIDRELNKACVLKFLPLDIAGNEKARKDLIREAGLLAKVKSEYAVKVYNCYILDDGEVFMTGPVEGTFEGTFHADLIERISKSK